MSASSMSSIKIICPVCLDTFGLPETAVPMAGPCLHNICKECFKELPEKKCPTCRDPISDARINCQLLDIISTAPCEGSLGSMAEPSLSFVMTPETRLARAAEKASTFMNTQWAPDTTNPNSLTTRELDILWEHERDLTEAVLVKIYTKLSGFYTFQCSVTEKYKLEGAKNRYNQLCQLGARPKAVEESNAVAQFCMAHCLFHGINVPKDIVTALKYYKLAADQGLALAIHCLGQVYCEGYGVRVNTKAAVKLYKQAAKQNCIESLTELGKCYLAGQGTMMSFEKALDKLELAAELGSIEAMTTLGDYYSKKEKNYLGNDVLNLELAVDYYRRAIERGHEDAEEDLQRCLNPKSQPIGGCTMM